MKCGFFELDITPPLGSIIPGAFEARYGVRIRDRLYVRAFVAIGEETLAIVSIDACGITWDITERIRTRISRFSPIKPANVMVVATHCHGGGPTLNWGEEVIRDPAYIDNLVNKAADAVTTSYQNAQESDLVYGRKELFGYSFVRVYRMKDGRLVTNPSRKRPDLIGCPSTTIDAEVLVLAVKQGERFVGAVVNFANHPAIVANDEISGDYISELSRGMKNIYGWDFVTVFINGACGNINHIDPFDPSTAVRYRERMVGQALAEKAKEAIEHGTQIKNCALATAEKKITVRLRKPSEKAILEAKEVLAHLGDSLSEMVPGKGGYKDTFFAMQALSAMADKRTTREIVLQVFKIGDIYVAGTPGQLFVQFGKAIKKGINSPCFVSAFANDYAGYVPVEECFGEKDVYEAKLCPTSALEPTAGDKIVQGILELYQEINTTIG